LAKDGKKRENLNWNRVLGWNSGFLGVAREMRGKKLNPGEGQTLKGFLDWRGDRWQE